MPLAASAAKSPFFRPTDKATTKGSGNGGFFRTPGGTTRRKTRLNNNNNNNEEEKDDQKKEHKSTLLGCSANLVNAIVGAGIAGLPYAIQEAGFVPGILLVIFCALLTEKSLRLLIETAKHSNVPSYETVAEAAYGRFGFLFVTINMFIMAYGAMLSYLMIIKDTFSSILLPLISVSEDDILMRRAVLILISSLVVLPLSCQRDMADLAKTSKMNVMFDLIMVLLVVYMAFHHDDDDSYDDNGNGEDYIDINRDFDKFDDDLNISNSSNNNNDLWKIRWDTIFIGLGALSFAFVCQHSSFIIAGSLERPTKQRWSYVTKIGVGFAASLALLMGICGYLGFRTANNGSIGGNILNSLPPNSQLTKIAKGLLGTTMLFVYPMESFVARHACVVMLFQGRKAHEGDDTSVLNRRDRRITITVILYLITVIPAALFQDLGIVLSITGAVGGSCLSYIGPGIVYIGIHGGRFLELSELYFGRRFLLSSTNKNIYKESIPLIKQLDDDVVDDSRNQSTSTTTEDDDCFLSRSLKTLLWYLLGMPAWTTLAKIGKGCLTSYVTEMAMKSPHPIRIGNVRFARAKILGGSGGGGDGDGDNAYTTRVVMLQNDNNNKSNSSSSTSTSTELLETSYATDNSITTDSDQQQHYSFGGRTGAVTTKLLRADSLPKLSNKSYKMQTLKDGRIVVLPPSAFLQQQQQQKREGNSSSSSSSSSSSNYQSINQKIGRAMANAAAANEKQQEKEKEEGEDIAIEDDPQADPPTALDFVLAISYVIFGVIAMSAGLMSIFLKS